MRVVEFLVDENDEDNGVYAISLVDKPAIEEDFIYFAEAKHNFATVDSDERIIMGAVMIPDLEIMRLADNGEKYKCWFSKETVKKCSQMYMKNSAHQSSTIDHKRTVNGLTTVELWLIVDEVKDKSRAYGLKHPIGTWMISQKIDNEEVWQNYIKEGIVKGFSVEAKFGEREQEMSEDSTLEAIRQIIIGDENTTNVK